MKKVKGNLLTMFDAGEFNAIVHGCNCHHDMSGGIAAQIAKRWPDVVEADLRTKRGDIFKRGTIEGVLVPEGLIFNAYTQYNPGPDASLQAIYFAFAALKEFVYERDIADKIKIGIPAIGCGIGGLTWNRVEETINTACPELDITLVEFDG